MVKEYMDRTKYTNFIRKFFRRTPQNQAWRQIDVPQDTPSNGSLNQSLAAKARQKTQKLLNFFSILRQIWRIAKPYWRSQDRFRAYGLLAGALLLNFGTVTMAVKINQINSSLFDALQNYDAKEFLNNLLMFGGVAAVYIGFAVYRYYLQQILAIRWRKWLTEYYCDRYLSQHIYYHLQMSGRAADNPDQRLADDAHQFIAFFLKFTLGVANALLTLISFIVVLWRLSGSLTLDLSVIGIDLTLVIPGYLVFLSLLYAGFGTWMTLRLSRPLVALNYHMEKSEADLRFSLIRLRESAEQVALLRGEAQENRRLRDRLSQLIEITYAVAKRRKLMIVLTSGYSQISSIFPLMVIAPRFFAKSVSLGGMMQTVGAFNQVQDALSYLVDNYNEFAEFNAVTLRLTGFENALLRPTVLPLSENPQAESLAESRAELQRHISTKAEIITQNLQIYTPQNQPILPPISLKIAPAEKLVVTGRSGLGNQVCSAPWRESGLMPVAPSPPRLCLIYFSCRKNLICP